MHRNPRSLKQLLSPFATQTEGTVALIFGLCAIPFDCALDCPRYDQRF
jgi:hypothetical protein